MRMGRIEIIFWPVKVVEDQGHAVVLDVHPHGVVEYNNTRGYFSKIPDGSLKDMFETIREVELLGRRKAA